MRERFERKRRDREDAAAALKRLEQRDDAVTRDRQIVDGLVAADLDAVVRKHQRRSVSRRSPAPPAGRQLQRSLCRQADPRAAGEHAVIIA